MNDLFDMFDDTIKNEKDEQIQNEEAVNEVVEQEEIQNIEVSQEEEENIENVSQDEVEEYIENLPPIEQAIVEEESAEVEVIEESPIKNILPQIDKAKNALPKEIDNINRPNIQLNYESFGITMKNLRETADLSLALLSSQTRIPVKFLKALEEEDYNALPTEVYIIAYIRHLGAIYKLTEDEILHLTQKVRERLEFEIPDDISNVVINYERSIENEDKLRHIFIGFLVLIIIGFAALVLGLVFIFKDKIEPQKQIRNIEFTSESILKLQKNPKLKTGTLPTL